MLPISVLCTRKDSIYRSYPVDTWDQERDMMKYTGSNVVIAHPPCRLFSRLRKFSSASPYEKQLAYRCVDLIHQYGGVLEHPESSTLWKEKNLNLSGRPDANGCFTLSVDQLWFDHAARKRTWLYIRGCGPGEIPDYSPSFNPAQKSVSSSSRGKCLPEMSKADRERTPVAFARWLIDLAIIINSKRS